MELRRELNISNVVPLDLALAMNRPKRRRPWLAAVLNLLALGCGFLYLGRPVLAVAAALTPLVLLLLWTQSGAIFSAAGVLAVLFSGLALYVGCAIAALVIAWRKPELVVRRWQRWYVYLGFALLFSLLYEAVLMHRESLFGYETVRVASRAMEPTVRRGDALMIDNSAYSGTAPARGDLITYVRNDAGRPGKYLHRVVGAAGDELQFQGHKLFIGGKAVDETYIVVTGSFSPFANGSFTVPKGTVFVAGDNRDNSLDSREFGPVPLTSIRGRARLVLYSSDDRGLHFDRAGERLDR